MLAETNRANKPRNPKFNFCHLMQNRETHMLSSNSSSKTANEKGGNVSCWNFRVKKNALTLEIFFFNFFSMPQAVQATLWICHHLKRKDVSVKMCLQKRKYTAIAAADCSQFLWHNCGNTNKP